MYCTFVELFKLLLSVGHYQLNPSTFSAKKSFGFFSRTFLIDCKVFTQTHLRYPLGLLGLDLLTCPPLIVCSSVRCPGSFRFGNDTCGQAMFSHYPDMTLPVPSLPFCDLMTGASPCTRALTSSSNAISRSCCPRTALMLHALDLTDTCVS